MTGNPDDLDETASAITRPADRVEVAGLGWLARKHRGGQPVPAFVTLGIGVPVLIAATFLVDIADWSATRSAVVIAASVGACCVSAELLVAVFLGVIAWLFVDGFVEDTGAVLRIHHRELVLFAACVALPSLVALVSALLRRTRPVAVTEE